MRVLLMMASAGVTTGLAAFTYHGPGVAAVPVRELAAATREGEA
jgi:hypothetical protein